jgi:hypothetical protein
MPTLKPPRKVISIADFALQSILHNADHKKPDTSWLHDSKMLREMDLKMRNQLDQNGEKMYSLSLPCCPCGTGCCNGCDSTMMFLAPTNVHGITLASPEKKISFKASSVGGDLQVFDPSSKIPDGEYILEIETLLQPPKMKIKVVVQDKKMNLPKVSGPSPK